MPELPEVETMVRGIRAAVEGTIIQTAAPALCTRRPILIAPAAEEIQERVAGQKIVAVTRRAKRVQLELKSGDRFVIEPRMTGLMLLADPPSEEHLRFRWDLKRGRQTCSLWFWDRRGLGTLRLLTPAEYEQLLGPHHLGPDALEMTADAWQERLLRTTRPVKVALLDQKLVAGIGNLYASEILHLARIAPQLPAHQLTAVQILALDQATRQVLELAIHYEGSTLSDGTYRNVLNQNGGYQNEHRVYKKEGTLCRQCGQGTITRIVQAQRSTFFCPACQQ